MGFLEARAVDELDEDAARRARMEERDVAVGAAPRLAVDELHTSRRERREGRTKVVDDEAKVLERRVSAVGEQPGDARLAVGRLDELDTGVRCREEDDADPLVGDLAHLTGGQAERVAIERQRVGDRRDHDRDVMELSRFIDHPRSAGTYVPKAERRSAQISPSVTSPSTAATIGGMRFAVPCAAARSSMRSRSVRAASRRRRSAARRSRWRAATDSATLSVTSLAPSPPLR